VDTVLVHEASASALEDAYLLLALTTGNEDSNIEEKSTLPEPLLPPEYFSKDSDINPFGR